jgi:hypothetical protein
MYINKCSTEDKSLLVSYYCFQKGNFTTPSGFLLLLKFRKILFFYKSHSFLKKEMNDSSFILVRKAKQGEGFHHQPVWRQRRMVPAGEAGG